MQREKNKRANTQGITEKYPNMHQKQSNIPLSCNDDRFYHARSNQPIDR